jgi:DNA-binding transcriptional ArsR family regulator
MEPNVLTALAEPNRRRIVELLRDGPRPVGYIAERLRLRQPQVSKHLKVLSDAGVVAVRPAANQRIYQLQPKPFKELDSWLETFRRAWEDRLDKLDDYLQELKANQPPSADDPQSSPDPSPPVAN